MADAAVPEDVQRLLADHVESFEQLECLLLLWRRPDLRWSPERVAAELRLEDAITEEALCALNEHGLLSVEVSPTGRLYRYEPTAPELARVVERLASEYENQRVALMRLMTANAIQRMRAGAISVFANAFLFRRGNKPNG